MSIEDKLITLIDDTEENKTNEESFNDESNTVERRIVYEREKLEDLAQKYSIGVEETDVLLGALEQDLQDIHDKTAENRFRFNIDDI
jgi:hypothetical protein